MLNAEEESSNEGLEVKNLVFAMAVASNSRPNNNNGYNQSYNQSYNNRGKGRGNYKIEEVEEEETLTLHRINSINSISLW